MDQAREAAVPDAPRPGAELRSEIAAESARLRPLAAEERRLDAELAAMRTRLDEMERSVWWRITWPLRAARALVRNRHALALRAGRRIRARLDA